MVGHVAQNLWNPSAVLCSQLSPVVQSWCVGVGWAGGTWPPPLWLCAPNNGNQRTCMAFPLHLHLTLGLVRECSFYPSASVVPLLGFAGNVLCNPTQKVRGGNSGKLRESNQASWFCFSVWKAHVCASTLTRSLGSVTVCTATPGGMLTKCLCWWEWQPQSDSSPLQADPCSELLAAELCLWILWALLPSCIPILFPPDHL